MRVPGAITFLSSTTPVDTEHVTVRWIFTAPRSLGPQAAVYAREQFAGGVSQDLPIWENKRFVARPVLTKGERVLLEQRAWAEQFYTWPADQEG